MGRFVRYHPVTVTRDQYHNSFVDCYLVFAVLGRRVETY
jgi:hypothetical protein